MRLTLLTLLCWLGGRASAQVNLTVVDERGEPMYGVNVYTPDYAFAESTLLDGRVAVPRLGAGDTLTVSFTGYESVALTYGQLLREVGRQRPGQSHAFPLEPTLTELAAAVVVGRRDDLAEDLPWTVSVVSEGEIRERNPQTSAHALEAGGEVYVQRSQMGGGSPVVRGFEANRILLVVDGVRLNNAIYRSGHLQNAITVDAAMLERVEVLFGAGSLNYGSDALGGVIHFRTREPRLALDGEHRSSGNYFLRFASANLEKTAHADYNYAAERFATQTSVSVSSFADQRAGARYNHPHTDFGQVPFYVGPDGATVLANVDPLVQRGTGYDQIDLQQKVKWRLRDERYVLANVQFSNSTQVPRFDRLTQVTGDRPQDLKFAEWYYGPQRRFLASVRLVSSAPTPLHDRAQWIAAYQRLDEDRYDRRLDNQWRGFSLVDVGVASATFDADKYLGADAAHELTYGLEVQRNDVASLGGRVSVANEVVLLDQVSRYPSGGSGMLAGGAYLTYHFAAADERLHTQAGMRYSASRLTATFGAPGVDEPVAWPQALREGVSATADAVTYAAGGTYDVTAHTRLQLLGSTAFRAPNVDDFAKVRVKNGYVSVPNLDLAPERALNGELTLTQAFGTPVATAAAGFGGSLSATAFVSAIRDVIVRADGALPNGDTTFASGEDVYRVQVNANADRGLVRGVGARLDLRYGPAWTLAARATYTRGRSFDAADVETPLAHIPPLYGQVALGYARGRWRAGVTHRFNAAKRWGDYAPAGSSDNEDQAIENVGTPRWATLDVNAGVELGKRVELQGGLENVADLHYRPFSSGVSAPGRNLVLALRGRF